MTRPAVVLVLIAASAGLAGDKPAEKARTFEGKVVALASLLKADGVEQDNDASAGLALQCDKGEVYPLVKNDGSRMFFLDKSLQSRTVRLTGRLTAGSMLDVTAARSVVKGKEHVLYYWCDNCALAYSQPGVCLCCGGKVKLVEAEAKPGAAKLELLLPKDE